MDKQGRDKARDLAYRLRGSVGQHLGPASKRQEGLIRLNCERVVGEDYERFIFWLTGYEAGHLPKAWATVLIRLVVDRSEGLGKVETLYDFFTYRQSI